MASAENPLDAAAPGLDVARAEEGVSDGRIEWLGGLRAFKLG